MTEAVIVALITGACAIIAQVMISKQSAKDLYAELDKRSELSDAKIHGELDVLKQEVLTLRTETQKHNKVVERTYKLEERVSVNEEKIKVANNRIADLERKAV